MMSDCLISRIVKQYKMKHNPYRRSFLCMWSSFDITNDDCSDLDNRIKNRVADDRQWAHIEEVQANRIAWEQSERKEIENISQSRKRKRLTRQLDDVIDNTPEYAFSGFRTYKNGDIYHDQEDITAYKTFEQLKTLRNEALLAKSAA